MADPVLADLLAFELFRDIDDGEKLLLLRYLKRQTLATGPFPFRGERPPRRRCS